MPTPEEMNELFQAKEKEYQRKLRALEKIEKVNPMPALSKKDVENGVVAWIEDGHLEFSLPIEYAPKWVWVYKYEEDKILPISPEVTESLRKTVFLRVQIREGIVWNTSVSTVKLASWPKYSESFNSPNCQNGNVCSGTAPATLANVKGSLEEILKFRDRIQQMLSIFTQGYGGVNPYEKAAREYAREHPELVKNKIMDTGVRCLIHTEAYPKRKIL